MRERGEKVAHERGLGVLCGIHELNLALRSGDRFFFIKDHRGFPYGGRETVTAETIGAVYGIAAQVTQLQKKPVVVFQ